MASLDSLSVLTLENESGIATITINRPKALNAINSQVLAELDTVLELAEPELLRLLRFLVGPRGGGRMPAGVSSISFGRILGFLSCFVRDGRLLYSETHSAEPAHS